MTKEDHSTTHQTPAALIVLAGFLSLGVFVLTILDYALVSRNTVIIVAGIFLLALLSVLTIRLLAQNRQGVASSRTASSTEVSASMASWLLIGLTLLATVLRLCQLGSESFWYDETWTATRGAQPALASLQSNAPLAYLVAHFTQFLTRSEFGLRLAPALAGVLLIPATYLLGRTLYKRSEGLIAAGILTASVYAIYHSQELRFYAWQMLFSTLTLYFLLRGLKHQRWQDWMAFALTTALNLYSHPYGLFVLASEGLYTGGVLCSEVLFSPERSKVPWRTRLRDFWYQARGAASAAFVALLAHLPLWPGLLGLFNPKWVINTNQMHLAPAVAQGTPWYATPIATWTYELPSRLLGLKHPLLLFAVFMFFFIGLLSSSRRSVALALVWFLVPPVILFLVKVRFYHRYLSYFLPLFAIVVAHGIDHVASMLQSRRQRLIITALLTVLVVTPSLVQLPVYFQGTQKEQWRETIAFVESSHQPGDIVLVTLNSVVGAAQQPFDWYRTVPDTELPWQFFPKEGTLTDPAQLRELPAVTRDYQRVWFVLPADATEIERFSEALLQRFRLAQEWEFVHLKVVLYQAVSEGKLP